MTNRLKRFPALFRFVAVTFALVATASLATSAAADPPSAGQVQNAKDRVAAMTDQEVRTLAGNLDSLPAGAKTNGWAWAAVIIIAVWIIYAWK